MLKNSGNKVPVYQMNSQVGIKALDTELDIEKFICFWNG